MTNAPKSAELRQAEALERIAYALEAIANCVDTKSDKLQVTTGLDALLNEGSPFRSQSTRPDLLSLLQPVAPNRAAGD